MRSGGRALTQPLSVYISAQRPGDISYGRTGFDA